MQRRALIKGLGAACLLGMAGHTLAQSTSKKGIANVDDLQKNWKSLLDSNANVATDPTPVKQSNEEWRKTLEPRQYRVLREEGTEPPGSSPLNAEKRPGVFACAGCGQPLFTSAMKFESGTGWPSFFTTIPGAVATKRDFKMILPRTEYHCSRCGGHHGHLFNDGPAPTGQRYCNNGVALRFVSKNNPA